MYYQNILCSLRYTFDHLLFSTCVLWFLTARQQNILAARPSWDVTLELHESWLIIPRSFPTDPGLFGNGLLSSSDKGLSSKLLVQNGNLLPTEKFSNSLWQNFHYLPIIKRMSESIFIANVSQTFTSFACFHSLLHFLYVHGSIEPTYIFPI